MSSLEWRTVGLMTMTLLGCVILTSSSPAGVDQPESSKKSYSGYKLLRTASLEAPKLAEALMLSLDGKHGVHFWTFPKPHQSSDILTSPRIYPHVRSLLEELGIEHNIIHEDIEKLIQLENPVAEEVPESRQATGHRMDWKTYHRYNGN